MRDVIDYLEYDVDPDVWIGRLLRQLETGNYEPSSPRRFMLAKSNGFSRRMTIPAIPDVVLYRAIVDWFYNKAKGKQHKHVYFDQSHLHSAATRGFQFARQHMAEATSGSDPYVSSRSTFLAWLHYDQYRKYLILKKISPYIVLTDVANFFDSVLHTRISEALHEIAAPPRIVGLLFFLLERLAVRDTYSDSPRIGLPVDEYGCSRTLAHMVLLSHDESMVKLVGEAAYVRWADDQTFGVATKADALKILAAVGSSLAQLNLTPNAAKSKILTLSQARRHFHLDVNAALDKAFELPHKTRRERSARLRQAMHAWRIAKQHEDVGEWTKILSRTYRLLAQVGLRTLRSRALHDVLKYPTLASRIADYMRSTGSVAEFIDFAESLWNHPEQVYGDVSVALLEKCLRLEPDRGEAKALRQIASSFLAGTKKVPGSADCAAIAPLVVLRFGDRRSLPLLRSIIEERRKSPTREVFHSAAVIYAGYGRKELEVVRKEAAKSHRNNLSEIMRLIERITRYKSVPNRYKARLNLHFDPVQDCDFIDTRSVAAVRLLRFNQSQNVVGWLKEKKVNTARNKSVSQYDRGLVTRLFP